MGINISKMEKSEVIILFLRKMEDYRNVIMSKYLKDDEIEIIFERVRNRLANIIKKGYEYKALVENNSNNELDDIHSDIERFQNTTKYNSIINHLNNLLNDDVMFLNFMTSNKNASGLTCFDEENNCLYEGMNKALTYSIASVYGLYREVNDSNYQLPKEIEEYQNQTSLKDIQVRDIVTIDLFDLFNGDLYKMYFNGDSFEFNKRMNELLTKDKIKELSDAVNSSIYYNNETDFYKYEAYMNEAKNNALSINQKAIKSL